jgi:FdhD protein
MMRPDARLPIAGRAVEVADVEVVFVGARGRGAADCVAVEEPLEIRAAAPGREDLPVAVTMRTPGRDAELAVGFLMTEGLIAGREDLEGVPEAGKCNVVVARLRKAIDEERVRRNFVATASCGLCGKASMEQVAVRCGPVGEGLKVARAVVVGLPGKLREGQAAFEKTGGVHAAGLFDREGKLLAVREDVGRHNAVDKLVGMAVLEGVDLAGAVMMVSGRTSFEIVQKAAVAGISMVCAVSAPTTLAVSLARKMGITLVGFLRGESFNIYSRADRIDLQA